MSEQVESGAQEVPTDGDELKMAIQSVKADSLTNPVIKRLLEEVRDESDTAVGVLDAYNRTHNRHNR